MGLGGIMLTIILLMKGTNGATTSVLPEIGLHLTKTQECEGKDKILSIEDHSPIEEILTYEWVYSKRDVFIGHTNKILCQKKSDGFEVNPSYYDKVEYCDTTRIRIKNLSLNNSGYYKLQFLGEKMEHKESQTIFLTVSATPTEQCKPVIRNHYRNVLNCTTPCGYLDLQWIQNKTGTVMGNQSILPINCSWKNEVILCCLQGQAIGCYKGSQSELCTPITPGSCIENAPGDDRSNIHTVKVPDKLGLLALLIIPVILVIMCFRYWKKIKSWITMCHNRKNKSTLSCRENTKEEAVNLLEMKNESDSTHNKEVKVEQESTPTVEVKEGPESTPTVEVKEEEPESTPVIQVKEGPESTPTIEVKEEPESTPTIEVKEGPESTPTIEVKEGPESTPTIEVKEKPESTPTVEVKEESDSKPTQFFNPQHETKEKSTEHKTNTDSETMKELQELRHAALCKVCFANEMNMVFMPCNHAVTCANCSSSLQQCPVCRAIIKRKMNIHFAEYNKCK